MKNELHNFAQRKNIEQSIPIKIRKLKKKNEMQTGTIIKFDRVETIMGN